MVKCTLNLRLVVLEDKTSVAIMKNLLDAIDIFENTGGATVDRDAFLDALIDGINLCKVNNAVQISYLNWLIYDTLQMLDPYDVEGYGYFVSIIRGSLTYLLKFIQNNPELGRGYLSYSSISSDGVITLSLEDHKMDFINKIREDVVDMLLESNIRNYMYVSLREHLAILKELDNRYGGLLDYPKIIVDILNCLNKKIETKRDIKLAVSKICIADYLLRNDLSEDEYDGDEFNKNNLEILISLASKLMETLTALKIHSDNKLQFTPLPVDSTGICMFIAEPLIGNINVEEIGFF